MKKIISVIFLSLFCSFVAYGQKTGNIWTFGYQGGIDFNSGLPVAINSSMSGACFGSATICNDKGELLFYSNGSYMWDKNDNVMPNADPVVAIGSDLYPTIHTSQPTVIVPMPDSANKYFVFTLSQIYGNLYYSVVDMNLRGGLGDVVPGRKGILIDSGLADKMTAVTGGHCNIWVLVHSGDTSIFKAYEITGAGINTNPVISRTGLSSTYHHTYNGGVMKASPNGKRLALCNQWDQYLELFDFDARSGIVSNHAKLEDGDFYGACFSPDNSKLYVSTYIGFYTPKASIYQYDLSSGVLSTIGASKTLICALDSGTFSPSVFTELKLAPDGKIYFGEADWEHFGVISFPNLLGTACDFVPDVVSLLSLKFSSNFYNCLGLPNDIATFVKDTARRSQIINLCFTDSLLLQLDTSGSEYQWDDGSTSEQREVYHSGKYYVSYVTPPCVHHFDTFAVTLSGKLPTAGSSGGCKGKGNSFMWVHPGDSDANAYTYTWIDSSGTILKKVTSKEEGDTLRGIGPGSYSVDMRNNSSGCDTTISFTIPVLDLSFKTDTATCINDTLHFTNTTIGSYTSYYWDFGDGDTSSISNPSHVYKTPGTYKVNLVGLSCLDSISKLITVDSTSYVSFTTDKKSFCIGQSVAFYPSYSINTYSLTWNFGDGMIITDWQPTHAYDSIGNKIIKVVSRSLHCPDITIKDTIGIYPYPTVDLGQDTSLCVGQNPLVLNNKIIQPAGYQYLWNTGEATASIVVDSPGTYSLMITSDHGCASADTEQVSNNCYVDIPNAFTPNGDGINDYFFPRQFLSAGLVSFSMVIYDRWGEKVFETDNTDGRGWDGKFNGVSQPSGVYVYFIEVSFKNGVQQKYKGNVTLLGAK